MRNAQSRTALFLMAALACHRLAIVLVDDAYVWQVTDLLNVVCVLAAALFALSVTPYAALRLKCVAASVVGISVVELAYMLGHYAFGLDGYNWCLLAQAAVFVGAVSYYWRRSYDSPSDTIRDDGHAYLLRRRPDSLQGLFMAMSGLFGVDGGYSLHLDGRTYGYRRGVFSSGNGLPRDLSRFHIQRGPLTSPAILATLDKNIGAKWRPWKNCTFLRGLWNGRTN